MGANSFLASGGDNFITFRQGTNKADTGKIDLEAMVDYFETFGMRRTPDYAQRAVGVDLVSIVGDQATVNLSSLDFSTTEPKAGTVTVSLGGAVLGTATVDPSFPTPNTFDEIGRATVTFTDPRGCHRGVASSSSRPRPARRARSRFRCELSLDDTHGTAPDASPGPFRVSGGGRLLSSDIPRCAGGSRAAVAEPPSVA